MCCGVVNRGLALYHNKVYVPVNDGRLVALDAETGKPVWETRVSYTQDEQTLTIAPRIAKGKVIVGTAGGDRPTRGFFAAYDADTGRQVWKFYTVPGDPAKGFESEAMRKAAATWEGEWWKLGGGGSVWDGISYDPESELVYVGTGNAEPWPAALRTKDTSTGSDNLYVASIVAVNVDTGELKWHYQMVPGDEWDYDSVQQMILADLNINGKTRKVIMQANKNGFFYVLDRITGEFISGAALLPGHLGEGDRSEDRTAHHQHRSEVRQGSDAGIAGWRRRAQLVAHVLQSANRSGLYSDPRLGHVHLCGGLRFQTGPLARGRCGANRFESQYAGNDAKAGGTRHRSGAAPKAEMSARWWLRIRSNRRSAGVCRWATAGSAAR